MKGVSCLINLETLDITLGYYNKVGMIGDKIKDHITFPSNLK